MVVFLSLHKHTHEYYAQYNGKVYNAITSRDARRMT